MVWWFRRALHVVPPRMPRFAFHWVAMLLVIVCYSPISRAAEGRHRTIRLEPAEDVVMGHKYSIRSDAISRVNGVRAIVLEPHEHVLNITYRNSLSEHSIVHIHGINPEANGDGEDGFPLVASWLIRPREAKHVSYSLRQQSGTYFFHSHFNMQQERGLVLPLIIPDISPLTGYGIAASVLQRAVDVLAVLEDRCPYWHADEMPYKCNNVDLQKRVMGFMSQDWDDIKGSIDESFEVCDEAADGTDVFYVHHLINGMQHSRLRFPASVDVVRLRIINTGAMSTYKVLLPPGSTIIKMDGSWVEPLEQPHVWVGVGQRYEVLLVLSPLAASTFFVIAESFQATPKPHQIASLQISTAAQPAANVSSATSRVVEEPAREGQLTVLAADQVDVRSVLKPTGNADDSIDAIAKGYTPGEGLSTDERVAALDFRNATNYTFRITGDNGFMSFNGSGVMIPDPSKLAMRCIGTPQEVSVMYGEKYCITLINSNADSHVFHLHGHVFTTVETTKGHGHLGVWRDSVLVPGGNCAKRTVCFNADNAAGGYWPLHCHMNYHLASGMMLLIRYTHAKQDSSTPNRPFWGGQDGVCDKISAMNQAARKSLQRKLAVGVAGVLVAIAISWCAVSVGDLLRRRRVLKQYGSMLLP